MIAERPQRFSYRGKVDIPGIKIPSMLELLMLLGCVMYGWCPHFRTWVQRQSGVGAGGLTVLQLGRHRERTGARAIRSEPEDQHMSEPYRWSAYARSRCLKA